MSQNSYHKFTTLKEECPLCKVLMAVSGNQRYLISKYKLGATSDIANAVKHPSSDMRKLISIMDLAGPFKYSQGKNKFKIWIVLFLSAKTHVLRLHTVYSLSSQDLISSVLTYCNNNDAKILMCDSGSNFSAKSKIVNTSMNKYTNPGKVLKIQKQQFPIGQETEVDSENHFNVSEFKTLLYDTKIDFILYAAKRHEAVSRIELLAKQVKQIFAQKGIYNLLQEGNYTLNQFLLILSNTETIINSRPLFFSQEGSLISPRSIELVLNQSPHSMDYGVLDSQGLHEVSRILTSAIFTEVFLNNILDKSQNYKHKSPGTSSIHSIKIGDVVMDPKSFKDTKNFCRSIFRVIWINKNHSWCMLKKPRSLFSLNTKYKQFKNWTQARKLKYAVEQSIYITRATNHLVLITHTDKNEEIIIEPPLLQDFLHITKLEKVILGQQDTITTGKFLQDTRGSKVDISLNLFKTLNPELTIPRLKPRNNKKLSTFNDLSEDQVTQLLKDSFLQENPHLRNVGEDDFNPLKQIKEDLNITPEIIEIPSQENLTIVQPEKDPINVQGEAVIDSSLVKIPRKRQKPDFYKP